MLQGRVELARFHAISAVLQCQGYLIEIRLYEEAYNALRYLLSYEPDPADVGMAARMVVKTLEFYAVDTYLQASSPGSAYGAAYQRCLAAGVTLLNDLSAACLNNRAALVGMRSAGALSVMSQIAKLLHSNVQVQQTVCCHICNHSANDDEGKVAVEQTGAVDIALRAITMEGPSRALLKNAFNVREQLLHREAYLCCRLCRGCTIRRR